MHIVDADYGDRRAMVPEQLPRKGALLGGLLADRLGLAPAVALMAVGGLVPTLWILLAPLPGLRHFPEPVAAATPAGM